MHVNLPPFPTESEMTAAKLSTRKPSLKSAKRGTSQPKISPRKKARKVTCANKQPAAYRKMTQRWHLEERKPGNIENSDITNLIEV